MLNRILAFLLLVACSMTVTAEDWPKFLGPNGNAIGDNTPLNVNWGEEGPKVLWETEVGAGYAGPAVVDGKVYLLDRVSGEKDVLRSIDLKTGKDVWSIDFPSTGTFDYDGSRATATVAGNHVYAMGAMGTLYCVDIKTQKLLWSHAFMEADAQELPRWAFSQSPLVYKDLVIVSPQGEKSGTVAFNRKSGKIAWQTQQLSESNGYSSPSLVTIDGTDMIVQVTSSNWEPAEEAVAARSLVPGGGVVALDPMTGKKLWSFADFKCGIAIPPAVKVGENRLFLTGGYNAAQVMIEVKKSDAGFTAKELFRLEEPKVQIHPPILYKDHLYFNGNDNRTNNGLTCMTLDGKILWESKRKPNFGRSAMLLADNKLFMIDNRTGDFVAISPSPEGYQELARHKLLTRPNIWAPMAIVEGMLIVRDQSKMMCLDLRK
ncbi:MAG: PQQ-binding-like beta-propeller repeat protein [Calditrichia bacterium]